MPNFAKKAEIKADQRSKVLEYLAEEVKGQTFFSVTELLISLTPGSETYSV